MVFKAEGEILWKPRVLTIQSTNGSEKLSAANALPKNPAKVIPIWMVDKNLAGVSEIFRIFLADLSPLSACFRSLLVFKDITAISLAAKKAFNAINTTCLLYTSRCV